MLVMRTLKLTLAYDGTRYAGWQRQGARERRPTIQATLEDVLSKILRERVIVLGSGRTDAGVHAEAQVAHARVRSSMPLARLHRALNATLPPDITATRLEEAAPTFHAQRHVRVKRYRYRIVLGEVVLPFERRYVQHVRGRVDVSRMRQEARAVKGVHDFKAFCRAESAARQVSTRRTISDVVVRRRGPRITIELEGNGFLHGMVRSIVGTLLQVGQGKRPLGTVARLLRTKDRRQVGFTAPARGLCLVEVQYDGQAHRGG